MRTMQILSLISGLTLLGNGSAFAKGLDELSQENPETEEAKAAADGDGAATEGQAAKAEPMVQSASSKAIADKLFMATSFGWVKASRSSGEWDGSGMTDLTIGYKLATLSSVMSIAGQYRYAPVAVSGVEDDHSYRGVWETHYFGARMNYAMSAKTTIVGTGELGYMQVHLNPTDGQEQVTKHEKGGAQVGLGGGADFQLIDKGFAVGPRLNLGFGSATTIQVAGAVGFLF